MKSDSKVPEPAAALFPAAEVRAGWDDFLTRELLQAVGRVNHGAVTPTFDLVKFRSELAEFDFSVPRELEELLPWTVAQMEHGLVHINHPRYFGLFNPPATFPAQCADRIIASFNPQLATWTTSPAAVEIERHVIQAVAARAGLPPEANGHFTSGGSEANYTAVLCALTRANPQFALDGTRAFDGPPVFYVSRESHLAWIKIAHQAGIGRSGARLVETDGTGRMDPELLRRAIESDRAAGRVPVMIAATAGTTNAGMIDPLEACAEIARDFGLWYHVDAAWGGAAIASDLLRGELAGIERADSILIDAHKWFATTMGCGMFITTHANLLPEIFQVSTSFMPSYLQNLDPYVSTVQWSRRFVGLRLFLALAAAGWSGYATHVERAIGLTRRIAERLTGLGWKIENQSNLGVICAVPPPRLGDAPAIAKRLVASGRAWVAATKFERRDVIRICVTHGETNDADIAALIDGLNNP